MTQDEIRQEREHMEADLKGLMQHFCDHTHSAVVGITVTGSVLYREDGRVGGMVIESVQTDVMPKGDQE